MRKVFILLGVMFIALGLFACEDETITYTFDEVLETIEIGYAPNDSINNVTGNIDLPTASILGRNVTISWLSSNESVLSNSGVVNRQAEDETVTLILSLRVGSVSKQILYDVTVKGTNVYYTITYDIDGSLTEVEILGETVLTQPEQPTKLNHTFSGWFSNDVQYFFNSPVDSDLVLEARFEALGTVDYTVEIYLENINDDEYTKQIDQILSGAIGQEIDYSQSRTGFIFNQDLSTLSGTISTETPLVIKAYYERLRFEVNYMFEETILETKTFKYKEQISSIEDPVMANSTFVGWYMDETFDTPFNAYENVTSNMSVYAKFNEITTGQYITNVYFENLENDEYTLASSITQTAQMGTFVEINVEVFTGFVFNQGLSVTSSTVVQNDVVLLDLFYDRIIYTVSFLSDSVVLETYQVKHGNMATEMLIEPEKLDHTFLGWTRSLGGTEAYDFNNLLTTNVTLYAMWRNDNLPTYTGYYTSLNSLLDNQIKTQLTAIITPMDDRGYTMAITILQNSDRDPNNANNLIIVYDRLSRPSVWTSGSIGTWNREHVWPQSKLGTASVSDVHNLKPADPQENSTRSNYPFVQGTGEAKLITNSLGGVIGYWPGTEDKGDIARILLYMHVRWGLNITGTSVGELSLLLRWHLEDPVDDFERNRNDVIFTYQENRNPFIDYPELAERIWGPIILSNGSTVKLSTTSSDYTMFPELNVVQDEIFNYKENQAYFIA